MIKVYVAFLGDKMIRFIELFADEARTHACLVHILPMAQHKEGAPINALIAEAVQFCAERGISYHFAYGKKQGGTVLATSRKAVDFSVWICPGTAYL